MSKSATSDFISIIQERGYLNQCTDIEALKSLMSEQRVAAYIGFDCTAASLHVGNLIQIMLFRILQQCGHKPLVLMGGATTKIGDPSGKDEARKILTDEGIEQNKSSISNIFGAFINFGHGPSDALMVDNSEWLSELRYIDYLRDYGKHFSVNRMLSMDSVKLRLDREQPLSFLEFNYMVLQAYDFVELYRRYGCRLQLGGSDQWGNIISGVDLGRRVGTASLYGLTTNLVTTANGAKMGKTAQGAIWLNSSHLSFYDYWQFWRNTDDADVQRFLKMFTELPLAEIAKLSKLQDKEINEAKIILANEATALCHGRVAAEEARRTATQTFVEGAAGENLPVYTIQKEDLDVGVPLFKLIQKAGLCTSGGEARRLIQGGGVRVHNQVILDEHYLIRMENLLQGTMKLSIGKKRHMLIKLSS